MIKTLQLFFKGLSTTLIIAIPAMAESESSDLKLPLKKLAPLHFDFHLGAYNTKETTYRSSGVTSKVTLYSKFLIDDSFILTITPVASFISGQQVSRDPESPLTNSLYLKEANIAIPLSDDKDNSSQITIGALDQKNHLPGAIGYTKSFPGVLLSSPVLNTENFKQAINLNYAIPTSSGLANSSNELDNSATLITAGMLTKQIWHPQFQSSIGANYYAFNNLTSKMASDSLSKGNSVQRVNSDSHLFLNQYRGYELTSQFSWNNEQNTWGINSKINYLNNTEVKKDKNDGLFLSVAPHMQLNAKYRLYTNLKYSRVESDAMVAVFMDNAYGRTNRETNSIELKLESQSYAFEIEFSSSKIIKTNPFQNKDQSIFLSLELNNVAF